MGAPALVAVRPVRTRIWGKPFHSAALASALESKAPSPFRPMPVAAHGYAVPSTTKRSVTRLGRYQTTVTNGA
jgi:hypothetical protein